MNELLRYATQRARELFHAEGCALLVYDPEHNELYFPVASQSESRWTVEARLREIRFPADRGIAGWVLARGEPVIVADVSQDERFFPDVDRQTNLTTRAVLCAPLRGPAGNVGVIEVINPGEPFMRPEDLDFLEALASDIAIAYEKIGLYAQLEQEVIGLRQACTFIGGSLALIGLAAALGAVLVHVAWALPMDELPGRPGVWIGVVSTLVGLFLLAVGRGWLGRATPRRGQVDPARG